MKVKLSLGRPIIKATTYGPVSPAGSSRDRELLVIIENPEAFISGVQNRCAILQRSELYPHRDRETVMTAL